MAISGLRMQGPTEVIPKLLEDYFFSLIILLLLFFTGFSES